METGLKAYLLLTYKSREEQFTHLYVVFVSNTGLIYFYLHLTFFTLILAFQVLPQTTKLSLTPQLSNCAAGGSQGGSLDIIYCSCHICFSLAFMIWLLQI